MKKAATTARVQDDKFWLCYAVTQIISRLRRRKNGSPEIIPGSAFTLDVMLEDAATWKEV
jgi:hypothetical protein